RRPHHSHDRRRERGRPHRGLHAVGHAAHVPGRAEPEVRGQGLGDQHSRARDARAARDHRAGPRRLPEGRAAAPGPAAPRAERASREGGGEGGRDDPRRVARAVARMGLAESLGFFGPEIVLSVAVLGLIFFDLLAVGKQDKANASGLVALGGAAIAVGASLALWGSEPTWLFGRMVVLDQFAVFFKILLGFSLVAAIVMSLGSGEVAGRPNEGEYYTLLVASGLGMLLMASAGNLLMAYLALEFVSLTSYVLTGFLRHNRRSGEAALKYLIYCGVASGAMIYGMSWVFGLSGSMEYAAIAKQLG